jgi:hypothetical protein
MADQDRGAVLQSQRTSRRGNIIGERRQRILHGRHVVSLRLQNRDYAGPARAIREGAVHKNNVLHPRRRCRADSRRAQKRNRDECGDLKQMLSHENPPVG